MTTILNIDIILKIADYLNDCDAFRWFRVNKESASIRYMYGLKTYIYYGCLSKYNVKHLMYVGDTNKVNKLNMIERGDFKHVSKFRTLYLDDCVIRIIRSIIKLEYFEIYAKITSQSLLDNTLLIMSNLIHLDITLLDNNVYINHLPTKLQYLTLGKLPTLEHNHDIDLKNLKELKSLKLIRVPLSIIKNIPSSLDFLYLKGFFYRFEADHIKSLINLRSLVLDDGTVIQQSFAVLTNSLPKLRHIKLGKNFNESLDDLPDTIEIIAFRYNNRYLDVNENNVFEKIVRKYPKNLKLIMIPYYMTKYFVDLPENVKMRIVSKNSDHYMTFQQYLAEHRIILNQQP